MTEYEIFKSKSGSLRKAHEKSVLEQKMDANNIDKGRKVYLLNALRSAGLSHAMDILKGWITGNRTILYANT